MITLVVDASTYIGTAAVFRDGSLIANGEAAMRGATEERLMPLVGDVIAQAGLAGPAGLHAVACGAGPGSFTSLRIAASIAKGLAAGRGLPLLALPSLALLVAAADATGVHAATMNALRGEWYVGLFDRMAGGAVTPIGEVRILDEASVRSLAESHGARLVGQLAGDTLRPEARFAGPLLGGAARVDLATWQPAYGRLAEAQVRWEAAHGRALDGA